MNVNANRKKNEQAKYINCNTHSMLLTRAADVHNERGSILHHCTNAAKTFNIKTFNEEKGKSCLCQNYCIHTDQLLFYLPTENLTVHTLFGFCTDLFLCF